MRNADDLTVACDFGELFTDLLRGATGNTGIHFIKNDGTNAIFFGQYILDGQHNTRQLTAGGDLGQRLCFLTGIGTDHEFHFISASRAIGLFPAGNGEPNTSHIKIGQLLFYSLGKLRSSSKTASRQGLCHSVQHQVGFIQLSLQMGSQFITKLQRLIFFTDPLEVFQNLCNRIAIFLLKLIDSIQARFDGIQLAWVKISVLQRIAGTAAKLLQHIVGIAELFTVSPKLRKVLSRGVKFGRDLLQCFQNTAHFFSIAIKQGVNCPQRFSNALGIADALLLLNQSFLFPIGQLGIADLLNLKLKNIHALQLVAFIHLKLIQPGSTLAHPFVSDGVSSHFLRVSAIAIQKAQVLFGAEQLLIIMLTMDINEQ